MAKGSFTLIAHCLRRPSTQLAGTQLGRSWRFSHIGRLGLSRTMPRALAEAGAGHWGHCSYRVVSPFSCGTAELPMAESRGANCIRSAAPDASCFAAHLGQLVDRRPRIWVAGTRCAEQAAQRATAAARYGTVLRIASSPASPHAASRPFPMSTRACVSVV